MTGVSVTGVRSVLCVVSAVALVSGCSAGERVRPGTRSFEPGAKTLIPAISAGSPSPSRSPRIPGGLPDPDRIDQKDATAVSRAALTVMYTVDSTVDSGLRDARLRAARYLAPAYAAEIKAEPVQYIPEEWRQHRAYLAVRLKRLAPEAGVPSDGPAAAYREWGMTTVPTGRDRWRGTSRESVVYMSLTRSSKNASWRISDVTVQDAK
ncbi:hypothetical protein E1293_10945 [Actinomadura darangshiensis]|uniref:Uncharacterized protein n=1 Tax=Actinomadura darangshiensis TaxID=705336 RepID=A0A4R5BIM7_9ACTN|nr:hypothetical protein [Actinomadura darangshiensis]TDD85615.1 hypothetical protein E1293_10945 [Actinomadura darangshiensis]